MYIPSLVIFKISYLNMKYVGRQTQMPFKIVFKTLNLFVIGLQDFYDILNPIVSYSNCSLCDNIV